MRLARFQTNCSESQAVCTMKPQCDMLLDEDLWIVYDAGLDGMDPLTSRVLESAPTFQEARALVEFFNRLGLGHPANQR